MGFNIKNNYGPTIEVNAGGKVTLVQDKSALWHTEDAEEPEYVEEVTNVEEEVKPEECINYFAPTKNLQELLKQDWFKELRTKDEYNETWTDAFIGALMESEWKHRIATDWAVQGGRKKITQIKGYIVGLLKDAGVLKGSYDSISNNLGITEDPRTFSRYMCNGKKQPYSEWIKDYVEGKKE